MGSKIDQKDINNAAWAACDTFRGVVDPAQYKDYILVMLFLKYISDVWQDHYEAYQKQYGDDDVRIRRKLERERFVLPVVKLTEKNDETGEETVLDEFPATYYSLYERRSSANIGELINIVLDHIEESNKSKLEGSSVISTSTARPTSENQGPQPPSETTAGGFPQAAAGHEAQPRVRGCDR